VEKIKLGVSACLLGEPVRYDGAHKLDPFLVETLGRYVEYVPVCPEVECGLGVPRESMRLEGDLAHPRLVTTRTHRDLTDRMERWAAKRALELEREDLCGFIFKAKSPSCGFFAVPVFSPTGALAAKGRGLWARAFTEYFPLVPVEEEGRLRDPELRENFIERIFALKRWRDVLKKGRTRRNLVEFHTDHKLLILAHSPRHYAQMGKLVARAAERPIGEVFSEYLNLLMEALELKATARKHVNVLQHAMGYFKRQLAEDEKRELLEIIGQYARSLVPLVVPVTLLNHYARKFNEPYLTRQFYLNPHPVELGLRNHV